MPRVTIRVNASEGDGVPAELMERAGRKATDILQEEGTGPVLVVYRKSEACLYYDANRPSKGQAKS